MGTRGLYGAVTDGEMKLLQYGQWDAYPSGQGMTALAFTRAIVSDDLVERFAEQLRALREVTEQDVTALYEQAGVERSGTGWITMDDGKKLDAIAPELSRDTCADIYQLVLAGQAKYVQRNPGFAGDGLFCEWSYVIDLDSRTLRVYAGAWSGEPHTGDGPDRGLVEFFDFDFLPGDGEFLRTERDPDDEDE